ncbi:protein FAM171B-like [Polymixia lowei]
MQKVIKLLLSVLFFFENGSADGDLAPAARTSHLDDGDAQHQHHPGSSPGASFTLKVQVSDALTRRYLNRATVEVYVNYSSTNAALTGEDGAVVLLVPYQAGLPVTVVASRGGYVLTPLSWKTDRMPIFSSMTVSLLDLNQANIWLFEDSVLINGNTADSSFQPRVQFPKRLVNLTEGSDISSFKAFLTVPKLSAEGDNFLNILGIVSSKSGYTSVELSPVAAISIQLFFRETELHVSGPIQITLPVPDNCGLQTSNAVPAWFFNQTTGGWMRKGLGMVVLVERKLAWNFSAPHLGYWIAAPLYPSRGFMGLAVPIDFVSYHSSFLMAILAATLLILIGLVVLLSCHQSSTSEIKTMKFHATKLPIMSRRDQTTSTYDNELFEVSTEDCQHIEDGLNQSFIERGGNQHNDSMHNGNVIANPKATGLGLIQFEDNAVAIRLECTEPELNTDPNDLTSSQPMRVPLSLKENLFIYNQPVAILHAPPFFHLEEQPEQPQWNKSATLPRAGASNNIPTEVPNKDSFSQTQPKGPSVSQNQVLDTEQQTGVPEGCQTQSSTNPSRGHYCLPESVSVPGTLNKIGDKRHSCSGPFPSELQGNSDHALAELSKIPSPLPPRAWFVSLEGKPAAEIHHAVSEQQRRRRPTESRDTSLDSGVDMSELNQTAGRRAITLERNATFVKSPAGSRPAPTE